MNAETDDRVLTQTELAKRWNITTRTLQIWHRNGKGPKRVKIGKLGYRLSDILQYEKDHVEEPGSNDGKTQNRGFRKNTDA